MKIKTEISSKKTQLLCGFVIVLETPNTLVENKNNKRQHNNFINIPPTSLLIYTNSH